MTARDRFGTREWGTQREWRRAELEIPLAKGPASSNCPIRNDLGLTC
jgi:hypothetical protein